MQRVGAVRQSVSELGLSLVTEFVKSIESDLPAA